MFGTQEIILNKKNWWLRAWETLLHISHLVHVVLFLKAPFNFTL